MAGQGCGRGGVGKEGRLGKMGGDGEGEAASAEREVGGVPGWEGVGLGEGEGREEYGEEEEGTCSRLGSKAECWRREWGSSGAL